PPHPRRLGAKQRLGVGDHPPILFTYTLQGFQVRHARFHSMHFRSPSVGWMFMSSARVEIDSQRVATIWMESPQKRVNTLSKQMWAELSACIEDVARADVVALIIASAKPGTFIVGADLFDLREMSDDELDAYVVTG